jgi:hypothetical protein
MTLLKLLDGNFDLCADFKRLYVYGQNLTAQEYNAERAKGLLDVDVEDAATDQYARQRTECPGELESSVRSNIVRSISDLMPSTRREGIK